MMKKHLRIFVIVIVVMMLCSTISVSAAENQEQINWESKISNELLQTMATKTDTDLIPVYIWLNDIDHNVIAEAMIKEKDMDPAVYENETRFQKEIVSEIEAQLVSRVGYEAAHHSVDATTNSYTLDENGAYHDESMSLLDRAVQAKTNDYIMAQREISKREHSSFNKKFIAAHVNKNRQIIDIGQYVTRIIVEATKEDIKKYARLSEVSDLSLYVNHIDSIDLSIPLEQVGAGYSGTKGSSYNNGNGYKGTGVKIGILEAMSGKYDSACPHLAGISGSRLFFYNDAGPNSDGSGITPTVTSHATVVTSIVVGQPVTIGSMTYEGVVPLATVYQTPVTGKASVVKAFINMVDRGVTVINYSGGSVLGNGYYDYDRELDTLIHETGVTFVKSAGNVGTSTGHITSPGKALNAITVGNADTINSSIFTAKSSPYAMHASSSYNHESYLPNKPDIVAPGTRIRVVQSTTETSNFYYSNGAESTGTSFAAPIVTGIVAQMQQAGVLGFKRWPGLVKSVLATSADSSKIRTSTSSPADSANGLNGAWLWKKSGVGLVNAEKAINLTRSGSKWELSYFFEQGQTGNTSEKYFTAGKRLRVALVFEKINDADILSSNDFDDINLRLIDPNGNIVASSVSTNDNVIVIDYVIPVSGNYRFRINALRFVHERFTDLYYYYSWNEY